MSEIERFFDVIKHPDKFKGEMERLEKGRHEHQKAAEKHKQTKADAEAKMHQADLKLKEIRLREETLANASRAFEVHKLKTQADHAAKEANIKSDFEAKTGTIAAYEAKVKAEHQAAKDAIATEKAALAAKKTKFETWCNDLVNLVSSHTRKLDK